MIALLPPSAAVVERWYSKRYYPALQASLTASSNALAPTLFDGAIIVVITLSIGGWVWWIRCARQRRSFRPIGRGVVGTITLASIMYLWFLAAWGLNYARPPLESVLAFDRSRITPLAVRALASLTARSARARTASGVMRDRSKASTDSSGGRA